MQTEAPVSKRRKILVVDDSEVTLDVMRMRLERAGFEVVTLDSPFGFNTTLRAEEPDLVLLDVSMPALHGDKLLGIARRYHSSLPPGTRAGGVQKRRCPVVLYSDRPDRELRALAESSGADGYVRKSSDFTQVIQTIRRLLS